MNCPACGSDDWKLASLIHKEGLSKIETSSSGGGMGFGRGGVSFVTGRSNTRGTQQSQLSKEAAPPTTMIFTVILSVTAIILLILSFSASYWFFLLTAAAIFGISKVYPVEKKKHTEAMAKWQITRLCQRCGTFYVPTE
jgi:hypothetical protein